MEDKLGVYICTGCGIGDALDPEALTKVAVGEYKIPVCKTIASCAYGEFERIRNDVQSEGLNKVVLAACSPRVDFGLDPFGAGVIVERVNLREGVIWCQKPNDEDTQMMAEDYLRMGIVKSQKTRELTPFEESANIDKTILVVGGGVSGMTSAIEAADTGYHTILIEKEAELGGWMAKWRQSIPTESPYDQLEETGAADLIAQVRNHPKITVHTSTEIEKIVGGPGLFDVTLKGNSEPFRVGAIIQATGWKPFEPERAGDYGYKKYDNVISNIRMEELAKAGKIKRPSDGEDAKKVAFLQCGGSRDEDYLSFCSSIIDLTALKQALYVREQDRGAKAFVFYDHIRTPGQYEDFYKRVQQDPGVFLTKGEVVSVVEKEDKSLTVTVNNTMLGKSITVDVDLVVLGLGMAPVSADGEAIRAWIDAKASVAKAENEGNKPQAELLALSQKPSPGDPILHLGYRQGPDLPVLEFGYPDSHFICFPYETRRTGIYTVGCVRNPMDAQSCREDAAGAALKAIQCVEMTARGEAVHPRSGDQSYPEFFLQRCTQCKRCTEECPFGVLNEDTKGTPLPNATRCRRCGVCMGACPERIVSFKDYSVDMIASMIKAVEVPDEFEEKPRVLCLACENDAYPALDMAAMRGLHYSPFVRIIPLRCLGSMNVVWVADALSKGFDGVILMGCKYGDDYQCHFIKGSELANRRGDNIKEKLQQLALENERVALHQVEIADYNKVPGYIDEFMEVIEQVGMNPFKGM
ncbi:MAG: hydrogenase iron-sulfur subunit [Candidatus Omnitrophota bacterium]|jgi:quinone-modifying oxidoreductase subunit QmoB|nr:MAG: hydrogenase iron-sulfur subunit [Candidatus Omnitrophota bacterium]